MPMPQRVQYSDAIEPLVQFIEDTPPSEILEPRRDKLHAAVPAESMLTASALAVTRSTEMPPGHHGGPLHPLGGLYAISKTVERLEGEQRFVPVLQHVALTNKHIHHPAMGPYALFEFAPEDAGGVEATKAAFLNAVGRGEWNKADHLYQWLWDHASRIEAFDLLLSVAIPKNFNDDHYFMFPGTVWRAFETGVLDKEFFKTVMRPVVRVVTRSPVAPNNQMPSPLPQIEELIEEHQLLKRSYRQRPGEDETAAIGALGEAIAAVDVFSDIPVLMAKALASGISLEGAGEALSIGAAGLFLRSLGVNPMDVHLHTSVNLRRYLLRLEGISLKNKLMLLLTWQSGPEIRSTAGRMEPQPPTDWSKVTNLGVMRAVPEVKETVNLATQYMKAGYDPQAFIARLAEIVCHDNFTEMHSFKHHQSIIEEFHATREPWRWMHLVCGAQAAAISFGKNMTVYEEYLDLLHAA